MAFFKTGQLLAKQFFKTEIIFNNILKENIPLSQVANKYLDEIRNVKLESSEDNASELLKFPFKTFNKLNKKSLENIITGTFNILKEANVKSPDVYMNLLNSYSFANMDFDMDGVIRDMIKNQVAFDKIICSKIINYYSKRGEIKAVEILLNEMKSKGIQCMLGDKYWMVSGYIIAGQPEQAEIFIKEHDLNMKGYDMFYYKCYGYASIADVASVKNLLAEMKEKNIKLSAKRYFNLYERLVFANVEKSDLIEIIDLTKEYLAHVDISNLLYNLISGLNADDHYNYAVIILKKLDKLIKSPYGFIELFGTAKCPVNTFKAVCTMLAPRCQSVSFRRSIFGDIDFESALDICHKLSKERYWKIIYYSILNKAINERSLPFIEKVLQFSFANLTWLQMNYFLQHAFLGLMMEKGIVSNYEQVLDLFPTFKNQILPVVLMKYLCAGDFTRYNQLISQHNIQNLYRSQLDWGYLVNEMRSNLTLKEINRWSVEARKSFDSRSVNNVLCLLFTNEMSDLSTNNSSNEIAELIDHAKEWNIEMSEENINHLIKIAPRCTELIRSSIATMKIDDSVARDASAS